MSYEVKTAVFEGPLDLLLQLITRHQVDITHLSLSQLVAEYLEHLEAMRQLDLEVTSEFLLIAATLIQLKARYLLPDDEELDLDEELALMEERDRLLARLLACATYKDVAAVFSLRLAGQARLVPRFVGLDFEFQLPEPPVKLGVRPPGLARIAARAFSRPADVDLDHLDLDLPSVGDALADLRRRMSDVVETSFDDLVAGFRRTVDVAAYFLAMLELARWGFISVSQAHRDAPIVVASTGENDTTQLVSEWE